MTDRPDLSALIGSRICHDLISPIGAIGNGVELMMMNGGVKGAELAMISESVDNANARIRFFRIAFGAAGGDARIARSEVQAVLSEVTRGSRLRIDWTSASDLARREAKMGLLAVQCLESAMPWGGRIAVEQLDGGWALAGTATRLKIDPALWSLLTGPSEAAEITPAVVHFALLPDEARRQNRPVAVDLGETAIRMAF